MNIPGSKSALYFLGTAVLTLGFTGVEAKAETLAGVGAVVSQATVMSVDTVHLNKGSDEGAALSLPLQAESPVVLAQAAELPSEGNYSTDAASLASTLPLGEAESPQGLQGVVAQASGMESPDTVSPSAAEEVAAPVEEAPALQGTPETSQVTPDTTTPSTPGTVTPDTTPFTPDAAPVTPDTTPTTPETTPSPSPVAPSFEIAPGRPTRSGPSYIGVGGNIGLGDGDTALGEGSFAVFSKIGLTRNISVRPSILFSDNATILLPVTFDFIPGVTRATESVTERVGFRASPFIGPGIVISTGDDSTVDFLLTGGVDVPITQRLSLTAQVNASFFDNVAVGLLLGVGFNF